MAITTTAILDSSLMAAPGFQITVSGLSGVAGAATITVRRMQPGPTSDPVRGFDNVAIVSDSVTSTDYEYPLSSDHDAIQFAWEYEVFDASGAVLASDAIVGDPAVDTASLRAGILVGWPSATAVIRSVTYPFASSPVGLSADYNSWTVPSRILSQLTVLGKPNPVILRDVSGGYSGTLTVLAYLEDVVTGGTADTGMLEQVFNLADTLMFVPFFDVYGPKDMYFAVTGDITFTRSSAAGGTYGKVLNVYTVSIPFSQVDRPPTNEEVPLGQSWQDVLNNHATWQEVLDNYATWLDVLNDPTGV